MASTGCAACLQKPPVIDRLTEANPRLKPRRRDQERPVTEGVVGSGTPAANRPVKANATPPHAPKRKGARLGHPGAGRRPCEAREAERSIEVAAEVGDRGPACHAPLAEQGTDSRLV
jgi:hypothetical protein